MTVSVDEALDAALADTCSAATSSEAPAVAEASPGEAVGQDHGPLSAQQAEKLLVKAIGTANSFSKMMQQILEKKAWEPLGYATPREMIRERFTGKLCNPHSGEPYNPSAIRRMSNSVWMQWTLSEMTGLTPTELSITTAVVSDIRSGYNGELHQKLVDNILTDVKQHGATTASEVQAIVDAHLNASRETGDVTIPERPAVEAALGEVRGPAEGAEAPENPAEDTVEAPTVGTGGESSEGYAEPPMTAAEPRYGEADATDTEWSEEDSSSREVSPAQDADAPQLSRSTAADAFAAASQGSQAPEQTVTMEDALEAARASAAVAGHVETLSGFPKQLGDLLDDMGKLAATVNATVAGIRAACQSAQQIAKVEQPQDLLLSLTDEQLEELRGKVSLAMGTAAVVEAAGELVSGLNDVEESWQLEKVIEAMEDVPESRARLEEFLMEIDFFYYDE